MRSFLSILLTLTVVSTNAQDIILMRNGDEIQCKLLEISKNEVKYKRWTNQEGPTFTEKKDNIFMLKYENGEKEVIANQTQSAEVPVQTFNLSANTPTLHLLPDPTPISDVYLKYTHRGFHSGLIKYGHKQSEEQAQKILTTDWLEYKKARRDDKVGRVFAITGGAFFTIGLASTVIQAIWNRDYKETKADYEHMVVIAKADYSQKHQEYLNAEYEVNKLTEKYYQLQKNEPPYGSAEFDTWNQEYQETSIKIEEAKDLKWSLDKYKPTYNDAYKLSEYYNNRLKDYCRDDKNDVRAIRYIIVRQLRYRYPFPCFWTCQSYSWPQEGDPNCQQAHRGA
ncbi:MAG: hypothetical protein MJZ00_01210 [Paludibacteraceae bacterium]|nr:hypothetical protein [Paludibacteraceae bacterium]